MCANPASTFILVASLTVSIVVQVAGDTPPTSGLPHPEVRVTEPQAHETILLLARDEAPSVAFSKPKSGKKAECHLVRNGGRIEVKGTSTGLSQNGLVPLLLVNPQHPAITGWIVQTVPNGIRGIDSDGNWHGRIQLGSSTYPPKGGEIISIAVLALPKKIADRVLSEAAKNPGEALSSLPEEAKGKSDRAKNVRVTIVRQ